MPHDKHRLTLLGLVFLVTLLTSAAHAGRVTMLSCDRRPHTLTAYTPRLVDPETRETQTGVLTACTACTVLPTLKPQQEKDALTVQSLPPSRASASAHHCVAPDRYALHAPSRVYALYPRPPTRTSRA